MSTILVEKRVYIYWKAHERQLIPSRTISRIVAAAAVYIVIKGLDYLKHLKYSIC